VFLDSQGIAADAADFGVASNGDVSTASYEHVRANGYLKVWAIVRNNVLVLVTYNSKKSAKQEESSSVEEIVKSVRIVSLENEIPP